MGIIVINFPINDHVKLLSCETINLIQNFNNSKTVFMFAKKFHAFD